MAGRPAVSVVIPTFQRPGLVLRAVRSALDQTVRDLEVLVVVDGRDAATTEVLSTVDDARVTVVVPDRHLGNAEARNIAVARSRAPWIAFLDDDDEWMPEKLARQLAVAEAAPCARPIVTCRILARGESGDMIWPRRWLAAGENWGEYFFCRRTPFTGEGMVTLSAILTSRALLLDIPLTKGLARHVDPDWLLRAARAPGVCMEIVPGETPLVIWNVEHSRARITTRRDWAGSHEWCRANRDLFSPRAYAAFVLHVVSANAAAQGEWRAFLPLLRDAFAHGRPALVDAVSHVANFALPAPVQRRIAHLYARMVAARR